MHSSYMVVLALGLLTLALIFAWAFELTPEGIKRDTAVDPADSVHSRDGSTSWISSIIGLLAVAVVYLRGRGQLSPGSRAGARRNHHRAGPPQRNRSHAKRSIAVLPFVNMSSDPEQEYFSDGLSEEILNLLAKDSQT